MKMAERKFKIRRATQRDVDVLVVQRRKMWQHIMKEEGGKLRRDDKAYQKWLVDTMSKRRFIGFVAVGDGGKVMGSGGIWLRGVHPRPWSAKSVEPYLLSMYTEPKFRGMGVATGIVKEAMKWCKEKGHPSIRLHASEMGRNVYSDLGWERTWEMRVKL